MGTSLSYHQQKDIENVKHLRQLVHELPRFCGDFFRGIEPRTSSRTRIAYAYDLKVFFDFLMKENPVIGKISMKDIHIDSLDTLRVVDIEEYMEYLKYRFNDKNQEITNNERGIMRKISTLKSFYNYYYRNERLQNNPAALVQLPKLHEKEIIRLDIDEVALLLDEVESGESLTVKQKTYHVKTKLRDLAILTLLLGTGIRVSECIGLDIDDIDFKNGGIRIHRKGGKEVTIYFGTEVEHALLDYLEERNEVIAANGNENALFLSMQKKRISVRSVENLVKKYSKPVTPLKKITPHKLRSTYGTSLYKETGDIYLVADVLGHADVNTTKKHYAAMEDERRRSARNKVKLRED
ncbi:tyrosine-type recombinase/integrase [Clostridium sp. E02]|uniref:tyrosine-type recombinase/integrase n=1 Tax=Clostridium sp. E02 TaxID=2487134 RepID=UPI000F53016D|nr:tyrosine-type recombinase/integrase [Clostridium sp. E02]